MHPRIDRRQSEAAQPMQGVANVHKIENYDSATLRICHSSHEAEVHKAIEKLQAWNGEQLGKLAGKGYQTLYSCIAI